MTIGHSDPIVPDLVSVPIVFAGAGLPDAEIDGIVSGTDIAPTALSALGREGLSTFDGSDLWTSTPPEGRLCRSERWSQSTIPVYGEVDSYQATSVWDDAGGWVFQRGSQLARIALMAGIKLVRSPGASHHRRRPQHWSGFLKTYGPATVRYGDPNFSKETAEYETRPFEEFGGKLEESVDREQLRHLGYLE